MFGFGASSILDVLLAVIVRGAEFTASEYTGDVLAENLLAPLLYAAVIECEPAFKEETGNCACPPLKATMPKDVVPS